MTVAAETHAMALFSDFSLGRLDMSEQFAMARLSFEEWEEWPFDVAQE
jgi:hypothetical protein